MPLPRAVRRDLRAIGYLPSQGDQFFPNKVDPIQQHLRILSCWGDGDRIVASVICFRPRLASEVMIALLLRLLVGRGAAGETAKDRLIGKQENRGRGVRGALSIDVWRASC
jgi:hypothetical protein